MDKVLAQVHRQHPRLLFGCVSEFKVSWIRQIVHPKNYCIWLRLKMSMFYMNVSKKCRSRFGLQTFVCSVVQRFSAPFQAAIAREGHLCFFGFWFVVMPPHFCFVILYNRIFVLSAYSFSVTNRFYLILKQKMASSHVETRSSTSHKWFKLPLFMENTSASFLDSQKAYNSIWRVGLLFMAEGVNNKSWRTLYDLIIKTMCTVQLSGVASDPFELSIGVGHGDSLTIRWFDGFIEYLLEALYVECTAFGAALTESFIIAVLVLDYAITCVTHHTIGLQKSIDHVAPWLRMDVGWHNQ